MAWYPGATRMEPRPEPPDPVDSGSVVASAAPAACTGRENWEV
jgi:hypothetical protein